MEKRHWTFWRENKWTPMEIGVEREENKVHKKIQDYLGKLSSMKEKKEGSGASNKPEAFRGKILRGVIESLTARKARKTTSSPGTSMASKEGRDLRPGRIHGKGGGKTSLEKWIHFSQEAQGGQPRQDQEGEVEIGKKGTQPSEGKKETRE